MCACRPSWAWFGSTANEVTENLEAAYRGNADGRLRHTIDAKFAALTSSIHSYIGVLMTSAGGIDTRDAVAYDRFHSNTVEQAAQAWTAAQAELDRLLHVRIDGLLAKLLVGLGLIGTFAGLEHLYCSANTSAHRAATQALGKRDSQGCAAPGTTICGPTTAARMKSVASPPPFNDMLAELAAARARETAERVAFAQATGLTTMGEMAASIAHEVNQPLAAIVANANAGLRWLANAAPDLSTKCRLCCNASSATDIARAKWLASVRAMIKKGRAAKGSPTSQQADRGRRRSPANRYTK